ncbi:MAG: ATPase, T2SS/T4P/T4SS family [Patescibacteria group bacterium]
MVGGKIAVTNDVVKVLAKKSGQPPFRARAYLKGTTDIIGTCLAEGDKVELPGFGEFKLLRLPARKVQTNLNGKKQTITLSATTTPDFTVDDKLKPLVGQPTEVAETNVEQNFRTGSLQNRASEVQFIELTGKTIPKEILSQIPEVLARKYQAAPFALEGKTLFVGMTDPENEEAFSALRKASGKIVKPFITTRDDVNHILDQYTSLQSDLNELVESSEELETVDEKKEEKDKQADEEITETSPAAKIVASLLKRAVREKASDIHIEPLEEEVQVRFRVDGVLRKVLTLPKQVQAGIVSRVKILSNMKIDETRLPQDGRIQIMLDGDKVDFRISTLPTVNGEKVVARVLMHSKGVMSFEDQGIQGRNLASINDNVKKAHGMILVTGPTGSGKSTTLYAIINKIKSDDINIITMEDPVEYRMSQVNQSQVNAKIEFTFATGLRSILRQDPDVVMVGEIRDRETADIAINAALTGHIVLSTLHTNDSGGAIPRLLDMGIEPFLITSSLNAVVGQRLCRKICDKCRQEATIKPEDLEVVKSEIEALPEPEKSTARKSNKFYIGKGCDACGNSGYTGRIGIYEILNMSEPIKQLTLKHASTSEIMTLAKQEGLITMKQDGILKAFQGLTTIEEVWRVARD